jgi:hypothetical protein
MVKGSRTGHLNIEITVAEDHHSIFPDDLFYLLLFGLFLEFGLG